jgi:hypothetical protein
VQEAMGSAILTTPSKEASPVGGWPLLPGLPARLPLAYLAAGFLKMSSASAGLITRFVTLDSITGLSSTSILWL